MTGQDSRQDSDVQSDDEMDFQIQKVFNDVPLRPAPTEASFTTARQRAELAWRMVVRQRRQRRWLATGSIAATALVFALIVFILPGPAAIDLALRSGQVQAVMDGRQFKGDAAIKVDHPITLKALQASRFSLNQLSDIRVNAGTTFEVLSPREVRLTAGHLYVDTQETADIVVHTPFGSVSDIGTRFAVEVAQDAMVVGVRQGGVVVASEFGDLQAHGDGLQAGIVEITAESSRNYVESASAPRWGWIHAVAAGYDTSTIDAALHQIARDLGVKLVYSSNGVEARVRNAGVDGDLSGLSPEKALALVLLGSDISYDISPQALTLTLTQ
jgi:hypothetical protein